MANMGEVAAGINDLFEPAQGTPLEGIEGVIAQVQEIQAGFNEALGQNTNTHAGQVEQHLTETVLKLGEAAAAFVAAIEAKDALLAGWGFSPVATTPPRLMSPAAAPSTWEGTVSERVDVSDIDRVRVEVTTASRAMHTQFTEQVLGPRRYKWGEAMRKLCETPPVEIKVAKVEGLHYYKVEAVWESEAMGAEGAEGRTGRIESSVKIPLSETELLKALQQLQRPKTYNRFRQPDPLLGISPVWDESRKCYHYPLEGLANQVTERLAARTTAITFSGMPGSSRATLVTKAQYIDPTEHAAERLQVLADAQNDALVLALTEHMKREGVTTRDELQAVLAREHDKLYFSCHEEEIALEKMERMNLRQRATHVIIGERI